MIKLDPTKKTKWLEALRSGEYRQGSGELCTGEAYCCLGVYAEAVEGVRPVQDEGLESVYMFHFKKEDCEKTASLPDTMLSEDVQGTLIKMNDTDCKSFPEIADWIEANL